MSAPSEGRVAVVAFWASVVAVASSSMVTVAVLSRHLAPGELAAVSGVLGLSFVCAVLPVAVQSVAGARRAAAVISTDLPWATLRPLGLAALLASPVLATALHLPVLAVALPVLQVVPALAVAVGRGELIAMARHRRLAVNHLVEAAARVVAGIALGWLWGAVGVALALLVAMVAAWATLRYDRAARHEPAAVPATLAALAALTVAIHLDVLLAPRLLGGAAADRYAVAALPAKGVYLALMAAGWVVIPGAAARHGWRSLRRPVALTAAAGVGLAAALTAAAPLIGALLGKGDPDVLLVAVLGLAMAMAAATWVGGQILIVKDSDALTAPPVVGLVAAVGVLALSAPAADAGPARLAAAVVVGQAAALASMLHNLRRVARATPFDRPRERRAHWTASLAATGGTAGAAVGAAAVANDGSGTEIDLRGDRAVVRTTTAATTGPVRSAAEPLSPPGGADGPRPLGDRTPRAWLLAVSAGLALLCVLQQPGRIVHETKLDVALDPGRFLARTFSLWEPAADFGHVQNQAVGYLFPMGPFYLLGHGLGLPVWLIQRLFMAALLIAAFWGMARLADWLGLGSPAARLVGGLAYALSPYMAARVGNTSAMVTGAAFLPWILLLLVRASKLGSTRRAGALAGLAVLLTGGVNAAVTAAVLAVPILWLLTRTPGPRRRALAGWFAAGTALATLWWLLPLFFQQRYGFNFLPYTERAATTTAFTDAADAVRGTADWLSYLHLGDPWIPAGWDLVSNPAAILLSGLVASIGLVGLARRDNPERTFLLLVLGAGVLAVGAGYGGVLGNPAAPVVRGLLDGPAGMFRNVFKFTPLIAFAVAMGVTHAVAVVSSLRPLAPYAARVVAAATTVVVLGALPALGGKLVSPLGFDAVPDYWRDVAAYHDAHAGGGRSLLLPGSAFGDYQWGRPEDEVLQARTDTPWGVRSLIPLGSAGATRFLDGVDATVARGGSPALGPALARAGVGLVIVRNDLQWRQWGTPRPADVERAMQTAGLRRVAGFGPRLGERVDGPGPADALDALVTAGERDRQSVEVYEVPGGTLVSSVAAAQVPVVSGGPEAVLTLEEQQLDAGAAILAGDLPDQKVPGFSLGTTWIRTDTLTRRDTEFGLSRDNTGAVLAPSEAAAGGGPVEQLAVYDPKRDPAPARHETVAEWRGIAGVGASSYGSWLYGIPEAGPDRAFDGDPSTAWVAGSPTTSVGEWLRVDLAAPTALPYVDVVPLADGPWRPTITELGVRTDAGSDVVALAPGAASTRVPLPAGPTTSITLTIAGVDGERADTARAAIADVALPGITPHRSLRLADDAPVGGGASGANGVIVLRRSATAPGSLLRRDEEADLDRRVAIRDETGYGASGWAAPVPSPALTGLLVGQADLSISASSTLGDLPDHAAVNLLDGDPGTAWIAQPVPSDRAAVLAPAGGPVAGPAAGRGAVAVAALSPATDADPTVTVRWSGARRIDALRVVPVPGLPRPGDVRVTAADGTARTATVDADGWARFEPVQTDALTLSFPTVVGSTSGGAGSAGSGPGLVTFGIADLEVPGLAGLRPPAFDDAVPVHIPCGEGPVAMVDGMSVPFRLDTTIGALRRLTPVPVTSCADQPLVLGAGDHAIEGGRGAAPLVLDTLVLEPSGSIRPTVSDARPAQVVPGAWDAEQRRIQVGSGAATVVVVAENANSGWQATMNGAPLTAVRIDGWKQGYLVPAGAAGVVELTYAPGGAYRVALLLGALLALLLAAAAAMPDRGRRVPPLGVSARELRGTLAWALVSGAALWIGGVAGVVGLGLVVVARRRWPAVVPWLGPSLFLAAIVGVAVFPGRFPADRAGAFSPVVQLLAVLGVTAVLGALVPVTAARRRRAGADDGLLVLASPEPAGAAHEAAEPPAAAAISMRAVVTPGLHGCLPDDLSLDPPDLVGTAPGGGHR